MTNTKRFTFYAVLACLALPASVFGDVVYTDTTFATGSYTPAAYTYIENDSTAGQIGTVSVTSGPAQDVDGGNTGNALETAITVSATGDTSTELELGLINSAFSYDPATAGDLQFVSDSVEAKDTYSNSGYGTPSPEFILLIEQGGLYYVQILPPSATGAGFQSLSSTDLVASDFGEINTTTGAVNDSANPNFSGTTMEFGLEIVGGSEFAPSNVETFYFSNLSVDLAPVPEPSGAMLLAAGLLGLAGFKFVKGILRA